MTAEGYGVPSWGDESVLELDEVTVAQHCECGGNGPEVALHF